MNTSKKPTVSVKQDDLMKHFTS